MSAKRALIVDDSRSARTFLTRILERYDLKVDGAGSAEEAIEYLAAERPDVIFMDHLMPGMDGFQALTAIKSDPRTAAIPVMMYTSQEGELYLNQARALGALGVLPKQTRAADVSRALEQLRILEGRPAETAPAAAATTTAVVTAAVRSDLAPVAGLTPEMRAQLDALLRDHGIEMRRFVTQTLAQHAGHIINEVRALMDDTAGPGAAPVPALPTAPQQQARGGRAALWLSAVAAAITVLAGVFWYRATQDEARLASRLAAITARGNPATVRTAPAAITPVAVAPTRDVAVLVEAVPFGEPPLAGTRVEPVRALLNQLAASGFRGVVEIHSYPGSYCMQGSAGAWTLPAADVGYAQCVQVGNPFDFSDLAGRQSPTFASMLSAQNGRGRGTIDVQLISGAAAEVATPYPAISAPLTAGEWNRAAAANNRVEVHTRPLP